MRLAIVLVLAIGSMAHSKESFTLNGKSVSKLEATKALYTDKNAKVIRISDMKLSDKSGQLTVDKK